jgi:hypothetical protein
MALFTIGFVFDAEGLLSVMARPAEFPLVHSRHREITGFALFHLEDLGVAGVTLEALPLHVDRVVEGHHPGAARMRNPRGP